MTKSIQMNTAEIAETIKHHLQETKPALAARLRNDTPLLDEWYLDSLEIVAMVLYLEKSFGIEIGEGDLTADNFRTIDAMAAFVERRRNG